MDRYQTFVRRLAAIFLDTLIFFPFLLFDAPEGYLLQWEFAYIVLWTIYAVISHGKYGQTVGKRIMKLKLLDHSEKQIIGFTRAFLRELIWIIISVSFLSGYTLLGEMTMLPLNFDETYGLIALIYIVIEVVIIFSNAKRRSMDDYIARSVVVKY